MALLGYCADSSAGKPLDRCVRMGKCSGGHGRGDGVRREGGRREEGGAEATARAHLTLVLYDSLTKQKKTKPRREKVGRVQGLDREIPRKAR